MAWSPRSPPASKSRLASVGARRQREGRKRDERKEGRNSNSISVAFCRSQNQGQIQQLASIRKGRKGHCDSPCRVDHAFDHLYDSPCLSVDHPPRVDARSLLLPPFVFGPQSRASAVRNFPRHLLLSSPRSLFARRPSRKRIPPIRRPVGDSNRDSEFGRAVICSAHGSKLGG